MDNSNKKRLHCFFIVSNFFKNYQLLIIFLINAFNIKNMFEFITMSVVFIGINLLYQVLSYYHTTYEIINSTIIYRYGIFKKTEKTIKFDSIQNIDTNVNFIYQLFNIVSLDINLIEGKVALNPISIKEANYIIFTANASNTIEKENNNNNDNSITLSLKDLSILAILKSRMLITFFAILALGDDVNDILSKIFNFDIFSYIGPVNPDAFDIVYMIKIAMIIIILLFMISFIVTIIKFYNFRLENKGDQLILKYGLLNKIAMVIKKERIQKISIEQGLRFRMFGYSNLKIVTYSSDSVEDLSFKNHINLLPIAKNEFVLDFLKNSLHLDVNQYNNKDYVKIPQNAKLLLMRYRIIFFLVMLIFTNILIHYMPIFYDYKTYIYLLANMILFILILISYLMLRHTIKYTASYLAKDKIINIRTHTFSIIKEYIMPEKIGSISIKTNRLLRKRNIGHITLNALGTFSDIHLSYYNIDYFDTVQNYIARKREVNNE